MSKPLIAISCRPRPAGEVAHWPDSKSAVMQTRYLEGIWRAGGMEAIVAPRMMSADDAHEYLSRVDGLVLVGGGDVDPSLYGAEREPQVYGVEPESDALEIALVNAAIGQGVPTLAICRGMQVLNVARGGTLVQHITRKPGYANHGQPGEGSALHRVDIEPGSLLAKAQGGAGAIDNCWSYHHQILDRLGEGLIVSARSEDGVVEAVEMSSAASKGWLVAIQWHPERTAHKDPAQQALFDALVEQSAAAATTR
jgi:putative glutamine amidotransferase